MGGEGGGMSGDGGGNGEGGGGGVVSELYCRAPRKMKRCARKTESAMSNIDKTPPLQLLPRFVGGYRCAAYARLLPMCREKPYGSPVLEGRARSAICCLRGAGGRTSLCVTHADGRFAKRAEAMGSLPIILYPFFVKQRKLPMLSKPDTLRHFFCNDTYNGPLPKAYPPCSGRCLTLRPSGWPPYPPLSCCGCP